MKSITLNDTHRRVFRSTRFVSTLAATAAIFVSVHSARATDGLAFSFEDGLQGFHANGGGITVSQDTVGATDGTKSMKISVVAGATFVGALADGPTFESSIVNDPPGLDHVHFDLTIVQRFDVPNPTPPPDRIGFANIGVTMWGATQPDFPGGQLFGLQAQLDARVEDEFKIGALEPGTYKDVRIDLDKLSSPLDFSRKSFNELFGTVGSGSDLVPTGFQFYINKNNPAGLPLEFYIDNVRFGMSVPGDYNGNDVVDAGDYVLWRKLPGTLPADHNFRNEVVTPGTVEAGDYAAWRARFGNNSAPGSGSGLEGGAVPEPASVCLLLIVAGAACCVRKQRDSVG